MAGSPYEAVYTRLNLPGEWLYTATHFHDARKILQEAYARSQSVRPVVPTEADLERWTITDAVTYALAQVRALSQSIQFTAIRNCQQRFIVAGRDTKNVIEGVLGAANPDFAKNWVSSRHKLFKQKSDIYQKYERQYGFGSASIRNAQYFAEIEPLDRQMILLRKKKYIAEIYYEGLKLLRTKHPCFAQYPQDVNKVEDVFIKTIAAGIHGVRRILRNILGIEESKAGKAAALQDFSQEIETDLAFLRGGSPKQERAELAQIAQEYYLKLAQYLHSLYPDIIPISIFQSLSPVRATSEQLATGAAVKKYEQQTKSMIRGLSVVRQCLGALGRENPQYCQQVLAGIPKEELEKLQAEAEGGTDASPKTAEKTSTQKTYVGSGPPPKQGNKVMLFVIVGVAVLVFLALFRK